ncbi:hypothetical protein [Corallococcus sp. RDP092CA]|uniref:hypothetical protein n=1 Tax=Corallococcus sp. RDP092CA TaxID=3109369 RepID=UPI0035B4548C
MDAVSAVLATSGATVARVDQQGISTGRAANALPAQEKDGAVSELDLTALAAQSLVVMAPYLPTLAGLGAKAAEGVAKKVGETAFAAAKQLWDRLGDKLLARPGAKDAIEVLAVEPDSGDAIGALRMQLKTALMADLALARDVQAILGAPSVQEVVLLRSHAGNIKQESSGGPAKHSVTITDGSALDITQRKS